MNKKVLISSIIIIVLICIVGSTLIFANNKKNTNMTNNNDDNSNTNNDNNQNSNNKENNKTTNKTLVVYYSAQSHTKAVAEKIAKNLNAETFEIIPTDIYTSSDLDWTDNNSRVTKEHNDESLRDIKLVSTTVPNWDDYDTILIGYPIWWGIAAWPVNNFVKNNDFTGKTVILFCTSASSSLGQSGELLKAMAKGGNWQEGHRFNSNPSEDTIKSFADSIK